MTNIDENHRHTTHTVPGPRAEAARARRRWRAPASFAAGIAITLAAGGALGVAAAGAGSGSTYVPVEPTRVLDTRDGADLGLPGPFVSPVPQVLDVTGPVPTPSGTAVVVPDGATGVSLNVTVVEPGAAGFLSVRPGDATGPITTSNLNVAPGATTPNAVSVALPTSGSRAGTIEITFDAYGAVGPTAEVLVDVVGYTTRSDLDQLAAALAAKANRDEVYTRDEARAAFVGHGPVVLTHGNLARPHGAVVPSYHADFSNRTSFGGGIVVVDVTGPQSLGGVAYELESFRYCILERSDGAALDALIVYTRDERVVLDEQPPTTVGCHTVPVGHRSDSGYTVSLSAGGTGTLGVASFASTWVPA